MVTSNFGKLCDYDNNIEDWQNYVEHLEIFLYQTMFLICKKKRAILFNILWDRNVPFKGLTAHAEPMEKSFNELLTLMTNHENPKRNPIPERFKVNMHCRMTGERVSQSWQN